MPSHDQRPHLIGKTVRAAAIDEHDQLLLDFGDKWRLVVMNPFIVDPESPAGLIGAALVVFEERGTTELLAFENGATITVDMRPDAYIGPEAMLFIGPGICVVWN